MTEHSWGYCCDQFAGATRPGTDGEMYEAAIYPVSAGWAIGCYDAIRFCPWCGKKLEKEDTPQ